MLNWASIRGEEMRGGRIVSRLGERAGSRAGRLSARPGAGRGLLAGIRVPDLSEYAESSAVWSAAGASSATWFLQMQQVHLSRAVRRTS